MSLELLDATQLMRPLWNPGSTAFKRTEIPDPVRPDGPRALPRGTDGAGV